MKLTKKQLGKLCIVKWEDAKGQIRADLTEFIRKGLCINESVGWLKYYDSKVVVIASERTIGDDYSFDLAMIPYDNVLNIEFIEEEE